MRRKILQAEAVCSESVGLAVQHLVRAYERVKHGMSLLTDKLRQRRRQGKQGTDIGLASDERLMQIYMAQDSSLEDVTSVYKIYKLRHGVPIYLDIAIAITEKLIQQQEDPRYKEPKEQEALLKLTIGQILKEVKSKYNLK